MESIREALGNTVQNVGSIVDGGNLARHRGGLPKQGDPNIDPQLLYSLL